MKKLLFIPIILIVLCGCDNNTNKDIEDILSGVDIDNKTIEIIKENIENTSIDVDSNSIEVKEENYDFDNVLDIPTARLTTDEQGRELLEIDLTLETINYLRKYKKIEVEYVDEFGDVEKEVEEGYYCPLYDHGYRLIKVYDYAAKIDSETKSPKYPSTIWGNEKILKIKGTLTFCKLEDYASFDMRECQYYMCGSDGACTASPGTLNENFPY